ncbi:MAG TPA: hypothetical protein VLC92_03455 [Rhodocyclaceae bacterium]|nr:hypothetical protein [Rhodocyclaceae bacterium]
MTLQASVKCLDITAALQQRKFNRKGPAPLGVPLFAGAMHGKLMRPAGGGHANPLRLIARQLSKAAVVF